MELWTAMLLYLLCVVLTPELKGTHERFYLYKLGTHKSDLGLSVCARTY